MTVFSVMFRIRLSYPEISMFVNSQHVFLVIFFLFRHFRYCVNDYHVLNETSRYLLRRESSTQLRCLAQWVRSVLLLPFPAKNRNNGVNQVSGADKI